MFPMGHFPQQQKNIKQTIKPSLNSKMIWIAAVYCVVAALKVHNSNERTHKV